MGILLLKLTSHNLNLNLFALFDGIKLRIAKVKVAGQKNLHRIQFGVDTDLAAEDHGDLEDLSRMRHTCVCLKGHAIGDTLLERIHSPKCVRENGRTVLCDMPLHTAPTFHRAFELRQQGG